MKKILVVTLLFFITLFCSSCDDSVGNKKENINRYDTAYNSKTDVSIRIGESAKSVNKKIAKDEYKRVSENDSEYYYEFREYDDMIFRINFTQDDVIYSFVMFPYLYTYSLHDEEEEKKSFKVDCDWYFKGGISAQSTKKEMNELFGPATEEYTDERGAYFDEYYFDENFDLLSPKEYKKKRDSTTIWKSKCRATAMMMDDELFYFEITVSKAYKKLLDNNTER